MSAALGSESIETLCRVGPGTPMGALWREYWLPVLRSEALVAGSAPRRIRILGEDFVAFRGRPGQVQIMAEACPHRGVSLVLGRVEECGIRCLYHGWLIDENGQVAETPNDPSRRHDNIRVRNVAVREAGGMIWAWFGTGEAPELPDFAFNDLAYPSHVRPIVGIIKCNWLPLVDNLLDPTHTAILHSSTFQNNTKPGHAVQNSKSPVFNVDPAAAELPTPRFDIKPTDYGYERMISHDYSGMSNSRFPIVMPAWVFVAVRGLNPSEPDSDKQVLGHVPIDDENTLLWCVNYNPAQPLGELGNYMADSATDPDNFFPANFTRDNNWLQNRAAIESDDSYTGIGIGEKAVGIFFEDAAMCESMGSIAKLKESLGPADRALVKGRRFYLDAMRQLEADGTVIGRGTSVRVVSGGKQEPAEEPVREPLPA